MLDLAYCVIKLFILVCFAAGVIVASLCLRMQEALNYLAHAYETNAILLKKGDKRGVDKSLIAVYRRKCLTVSKTTLVSRNNRIQV